MKNFLFALLPLLIVSCAQKNTSRDVKKVDSKVVEYQPTWSSLSRHNTPQWVKDAKFGIYCHWTTNTVRATEDNKDMPINEAVQKWTGEKFDAATWASLFKRAGAQFAGPVAWHSNGILNWKSDITDWNSYQKGPHHDIFGELAPEIKKRGMKLMSSYHSNTLWGPRFKGDSIYIDPLNMDEMDKSNIYNQYGRYNDSHYKGWYERVMESVVKYEPDMIWFDTNFGSTVGLELKNKMIGGKIVDPKAEMRGVRPDIQRKVISSFYNQGLKLNKDVCFVYKSFDIPPVTGIRDIENGDLQDLQFDPWMADINMVFATNWGNTWFYSDDKIVKSANTLIDMLCDIVSKNGRILLNVPPKVDGTFSKSETDVLYKIGDWLKLNGEAIYGTCPWTMYGEGPSIVGNPGHHGQTFNKKYLMPKYSFHDIRFTVKDDFLYAIILDWPGNEVNISTLGYNKKLEKGMIESVSMLGSDEKLEWSQNADELVVSMPKVKPCDFAYVLKLKIKE